MSKIREVGPLINPQFPEKGLFFLLPVQKQYQHPYALKAPHIPFLIPKRQPSIPSHIASVGHQIHQTPAEEKNHIPGAFLLPFPEAFECLDRKRSPFLSPLSLQKLPWSQEGSRWKR